jgi:hypothetical protein
MGKPVGDALAKLSRRRVNACQHQRFALITPLYAPLLRVKGKDAYEVVFKVASILKTAAGLQVWAC